MPDGWAYNMGDGVRLKLALSVYSTSSHVFHTVIIIF